MEEKNNEILDIEKEGITLDKDLEKTKEYYESLDKEKEKSKES